MPGVTLRAGRAADGRSLHRGGHRSGGRRRYGLNIDDVQSVITAAVGGETIAETVEGLQRFPISVRYPRELRDSVSDLEQLPIVTEDGAQITLGTVASLRITSGPPMLRSENARLSGWVYVDLRGRDLQSAVADMQAAVAREVSLPAGYSISWSGQFEYLERARPRLQDRRSIHAARDLRAAVPHLPANRRGAAHHGDLAVRADRRLLVDLRARARRFDRDRRGLHRAGGRGGGVRRRDAASI